LRSYLEYTGLEERIVVGEDTREHELALKFNKSEIPGAGITGEL
jgi:hypothetical protein